jgi:hypothetical protein
MDGEQYGPAPIADQEYWREAANLHLAPGWSWPAVPVAATEDGHTMMYQLGFGTQSADRHWFCSWASAAIKASVGSAAAREAEQRLLGILHLYFYKTSLVQADRSALRREVVRAGQGQLKLLRQDVDANC